LKNAISDPMNVHGAMYPSEQNQKSAACSSDMFRRRHAWMYAYIELPGATSRCFFTGA